MSKDIFNLHFGRLPKTSVFTPGRINLIGEHIDYNGGLVLPTALELGITIELSPRMDRLVRIASDKFDVLAEREIHEPASGHWSDYILGALQTGGAELGGPKGADIAVSSNLPFGAGLSSSAAVAVCALRAVRELSQVEITNAEIARLAQLIENDYIGVPCGIMDQMAVAIARPRQALCLNTATLDYDLIDLPTTHHMAVIHSGVFRRLSEGRYKIRKEECDLVKSAAGREDICLMPNSELKTLNAMPEAIIRRARHCISEHRRTVAAATALRSDDMESFGQLMNESHISMRDDFEISVPAVDALVVDAQSFGALGARLTGGGFGGCIVACVETGKLDAWRERLLTAHPDAFWVA